MTQYHKLSRLERMRQDINDRCVNVPPERLADAILLWATASLVLSVIYRGFAK